MDLSVSQLGTPKRWRLSDTYNLVIDLLHECNHCIFKAENTAKKSKKLVVKLTDKQREVEFYKSMGHHHDADLHVVDCVHITAVRLAGNAECFAIVMEQGLAVDLDHRHMFQQQPFLRLNCIEKLARAVLFLHGQGLIHGDIKLENVVYFSDRTWYKLIDFDHTVPFGSRIRHCTPEYCPPEMARCMLQGQGLTIEASSKFDVWCFGVLVLRLFLDGGHLEEFNGVGGDGVYELLAAPGFSFRQSLAKVAALNNRQKKYLLMCLEPDESKRTGSLRDILKALEVKSTTHSTTPASPSPLGSNPTLIGAWPSHALSDTNEVTSERHSHSINSTSQPREVAMTEFAAPEPWELPMLWSLDATEKLGKCDPSKLGRMRFRLVFQCEWCISSCGRFEPQDEVAARSDASLHVVGASDEIRQMLPILNASSAVRKALCVAALLGVTMDGFQFDLKDTQHMAKIASALESIHGLAPRLDTDAAFEGIVHRLETEDLDEVELADEARKLQDVLLRYRRVVLPMMKQTLASLGFDWNRERVGGLRQVQYASGYSRWVCQVHSPQKTSQGTLSS
ncbi:hypothetical protein DYB32_008146 [Aphanomyces invadans]|uniref:Protein kinase domain-containing protein n=1 Tax=Aphanomyces invadans TaxID=157072 RepID=A0A3R6VH54_9STRA|nr:hypothetical protein DYB32_008146 [Aphanomyces invadans]